MKRQFLFFQGNSSNFLLPLEVVIEVIPMTRLEHTGDNGNEMYQGLLNFRGDVIPVFDIDTQKKSIEELIDWLLIVVEIQQQQESIALVVKEVFGVVEAEEQRYAEVKTGESEQISVAEMNGQLVRIMDASLLQKIIYQGYSLRQLV